MSVYRSQVLPRIQVRVLDEHIEQVGFVIGPLYAKGDPKPFGYTFEGRAIKN